MRPSDLPLITPSFTTRGLKCRTEYRGGRLLPLLLERKGLLALTARPIGVVSPLFGLGMGSVLLRWRCTATLRFWSHDRVVKWGVTFHLGSTARPGTNCYSAPKETPQPPIWRENALGSRFSLLPSVLSWEPHSTGPIIFSPRSVGSSRAPSMTTNPC